MCIKKTFYLVLLSMDNIHNDITINNTGAPVWGRKRLQQVVQKFSVVHTVLNVESQ